MESRRASDILLEMEMKVEILLNLVRTQDLNIKILSNKINELNEKYKQFTTSVSSVKIEAAEVSAANTVPVISDAILAQELSPNGFRRTSRPETYSDNDIPKFPTQIPKIESEVIIPVKNTSKINNDFIEVPEKKTINSNNITIIPIVQRVVNKSGKSVFLADVEVIELSTMNNVLKTRTNGTGKWMGALPVGKYRIFIRKRESINKDILEVSQDINVDGSQSPLELKTIIIQ